MHPSTSAPRDAAATSPDLTGNLQAWQRSLTEAQQAQRALFEAAMRADQLRGAPTCFSDLT